MALPHFESVLRYLRAVLGGEAVMLRLYCQGNLLGASKLDQFNAPQLQGALALLETLQKGRVLATRFHIDPVLPEFTEKSEQELTAIDEMHAVLYNKEYRRQIQNVKIPFTARKAPGCEVHNESELVTYMQEIRGYRLFGQPILIGPIQAEFTNLKVASLTPLADPELFKIELQTTDASERIVRYVGAPPIPDLQAAK